MMQRIPGPAGLLASLIQAKASPAVIQAALLEASKGAAGFAHFPMRSSGIEATLAETYPSWKDALECFDITAEQEEGHPMLSHPISNILKQTRPCKIPKLLCVVANVVYNPTSGAQVVLKDKTGCIKATVQQAVLDLYPAFGVGATLALKQVSAIHLVPPIMHMAVTPDNVAQVFPAKHHVPNPQTQNHITTHQPTISHTIKPRPLNPSITVLSQGPTHLELNAAAPTRDGTAPQPSPAPAVQLPRAAQPRLVNSLTASPARVMSGTGTLPDNPSHDYGTMRPPPPRPPAQTNVTHHTHASPFPCPNRPWDPHSTTPRAVGATIVGTIQQQPPPSLHNTPASAGRPQPTVAAQTITMITAPAAAAPSATTHTTTQNLGAAARANPPVAVVVSARGPGVGPVPRLALHPIQTTQPVPPRVPLQAMKSKGPGDVRISTLFAGLSQLERPHDKDPEGEEEEGDLGDDDDEEEDDMDGMPQFSVLGLPARVRKQPSSLNNPQQHPLQPVSPPAHTRVASVASTLLPPPTHQHQQVQNPQLSSNAEHPLINTASRPSLLPQRAANTTANTTTASLLAGLKRPRPTDNPTPRDGYTGNLAFTTRASPSLPAGQAPACANPPAVADGQTAGTIPPPPPNSAHSALGSRLCTGLTYPIDTSLNLSTGMQPPVSTGHVFDGVRGFGEAMGSMGRLDMGLGVKAAGVMGMSGVGARLPMTSRLGASLNLSRPVGSLHKTGSFHSLAGGGDGSMWRGTGGNVGGVLQLDAADDEELELPDDSE